MPIYEYIKKGKVHYKYAFEVKDTNGKRKTIKESGFTKKTECKIAEALARTEWEKGNHINPSAITFGDYITEWLKNKKDIGVKTRHTNVGHINNHILPAIGHIPLQKLTYEDIEYLIQEMQKKVLPNGKNLAEGTIRKVFNLVQTSLRAAVKRELIMRNPIDKLDKGSKPKAGKPKYDYWSVEEVNEFLSNLKHRLKILFILAIYTGMRRGEILALKWKDINFKTRQIRIAKAKTDAGERSITTSKFVIGALTDHFNQVLAEKSKYNESYIDNNYIICDELGHSLSTSNFHKFWTRKLEATGVRKIRFHDLRHTCASLMFSAGVHPKVVQEMLGHSSIKVTLDMYSHMMPNMQADAATAMENLLSQTEDNPPEKE
ncbi:tyrosine-type recombinase/integrase [Paenibacillus tianjinensis]|uniref:Tyrosine-type recombinase/integrase n=1 Tax=Paenibacillus tianjinensis TaxID=2810347 RepID=A0ABX7L9B6_9BACL|nr:site-specific integrase [Paenibacillus tianjinensis]QSF43304.1 tyrosine-type recombinase/integrase [Paenibacillus tianjinensis]